MVLDSIQDDKDAVRVGATCRPLRAMITKRLNKEALETIKIDHVWMMPLTPAEERKWDALVGNTDATWLSKSEDKVDFPWHLYMKLCHHRHSWSMINRRRIWISCDSIYNELEKGDFLEELTPSYGS